MYSDIRFLRQTLIVQNLPLNGIIFGLSESSGIAKENELVNDPFCFDRFAKYIQYMRILDEIIINLTVQILQNRIAKPVKQTITLIPMRLSPDLPSEINIEETKPNEHGYFLLSVLVGTWILEGQKIQKQVSSQNITFILRNNETIIKGKAVIPTFFLENIQEGLNQVTKIPELLTKNTQDQWLTSYRETLRKCVDRRIHEKFTSPLADLAKKLENKPVKEQIARLVKVRLDAIRRIKVLKTELDKSIADLLSDRILIEF